MLTPLEFDLLKTLLILADTRPNEGGFLIRDMMELSGLV
jgi:hypothetical protein